MTSLPLLPAQPTDWSALMANLSERGADNHIVQVETIRSTLQPNVLHVLITDSEGHVGLGETFYGASAVEAHIHDAVVQSLQIDRPAATPEAVSALLQGYVGYSGSGVEVRARSAIDLALWDLSAKKLDVPLHELLAPGSRTSIPTYNTCSGESYVNHESRQSVSNWGVSDSSSSPGPYEDLWAFLNEPERLARELRDTGFSGMKVWPFDPAAEEATGNLPANFDFGLSILERIRSEVGDSIDLYVELHSLWNLPAAEKLLSHLERFSPRWVEDPVRADQTQAIAQLKARASVPIALGETLGAGHHGYSGLIDAGSVDVLILDLGWCGGLTDGLPVQHAAADNGLEVAYHDCTGPVSLAVAAHAAVSSPTTTIQEVARAFWHGWYPVMARGFPRLESGDLHLTDHPGHGVQLREDFLAHPGTTSRVSTLN